MLETGAFLAQRLGTFRVIPDTRLFELALDFGQSFCLGLKVKDTSSTHRCVR